MFRASVERFLDGSDIASRKAQRASPGGIDRTRWQAMADLGLTAMALDENRGGLGSSLLDLVAVGESFGLRISSDNWLENAVLPLAVLAERLPQGACADRCSGRRRSDRCAGAVRARGSPRHHAPQHDRAGDGNGLCCCRGDKTFVLGGMAADWLLVSAVLDGDPALFAVSRRCSRRVPAWPQDHRRQHCRRSAAARMRVGQRRAPRRRVGTGRAGAHHRAVDRSGGDDRAGAAVVRRYSGLCPPARAVRPADRTVSGDPAPHGRLLWPGRSMPQRADRGGDIGRC